MKITLIWILVVVTSSSMRADLLWSQMDSNAIKTHGGALLTEVKSLIGSNAEQTRKNIEAFLSDESGSEWRWTNVYILNRLYFAVPAVTTVSDQELVGWEHGGDPARRPNSLDAEIDAIYPLREEAGKFLIVGRFFSYHGNPYPVLREFDAFHIRYGLRAEFKGQ